MEFESIEAYREWYRRKEWISIMYTGEETEKCIENIAKNTKRLSIDEMMKEYVSSNKRFNKRRDHHEQYLIANGIRKITEYKKLVAPFMHFLHITANWDDTEITSTLLEALGERVLPNIDRAIEVYNSIHVRFVAFLMFRRDE